MLKRNSSQRDFLKQAGALAAAPQLLSALSQAEPARYTLYGVSVNRLAVRTHEPNYAR